MKNGQTNETTKLDYNTLAPMVNNTVQALMEIRDNYSPMICKPASNALFTLKEAWLRFDLVEISKELLHAQEVVEEYKDPNS